MKQYKVNYSIGTSEIKQLRNVDDNIGTIKRTDEDFEKISSIDIYLAENISAGDDGYYILPGAWWNRIL